MHDIVATQYVSCIKTRGVMVSCAGIMSWAVRGVVLIILVSGIV